MTGENIGYATLTRLREMLNPDYNDPHGIFPTHRPWLVGPTGRTVQAEDKGGMRVGMYPHVANCYRHDDAALIVALVNAAPALLDVVEAAGWVADQTNTHDYGMSMYALRQRLAALEAKA